MKKGGFISQFGRLSNSRGPIDQSSNHICTQPQLGWDARRLRFSLAPRCNLKLAKKAVRLDEPFALVAFPRTRLKTYTHPPATLPIDNSRHAA